MATNRASRRWRKDGKKMFLDALVFPDRVDSRSAQAAQLTLMPAKIEKMGMDHAKGCIVAEANPEIVIARDAHGLIETTGCLDGGHPGRERREIRRQATVKSEELQRQVRR